MERLGPGANGVTDLEPDGNSLMTGLTTVWEWLVD